jgi:hypothetical protein
VGEQGRSGESHAILFEGFPEYRQARELAAEVAARDKLHEDIVFSDAMHVAAALALEDAGMPYSMPNVAWMLERIRPAEVLHLLLLRRAHPDDYRNLPMAGMTESLGEAETRAATELARTLTSQHSAWPARGRMAKPPEGSGRG